MTRKATINDLPRLIEIAEQFLNESNWDWTFNKENAVKTFYTSIMHPECDTIVSEKDGKIEGLCIVSYEQDFTDEKIGDIVEYYVTPEGRGTGLSRELLQGVCEWFDGYECKNVFVKATANIGKDAAFINLFNKFGFNVFSKVLVR